MIRSQQFKNGTLKERVNFIQKNGNYLATRTTEHYYIRLYTLKGQYVEVWSSSHLPWEEVVKVKMFNDYKLLKPYLPNFFFSELKFS